MKLEAWRKAEKLTLAALGARLGCTASTVAKYERGARIPQIDTMVRIFVVTSGKVQPNDFYPLPDDADLLLRAAA